MEQGQRNSTNIILLKQKWIEKMLKSFSKLLNKEKDRKQHWKTIYWCTFECDKSTANSFLSSNSMQTGCGLWTINYVNHFVVIYYSSFPDLKGLNIVFSCSYIWKQLNGTLRWTYACWVKVSVEWEHTCNIKLMLRSFIGNYSQQIFFFTYVCKEWLCINLTKTADGMRREQFPLEYPMKILALKFLDGELLRLPI